MPPGPSGLPAGSGLVDEAPEAASGSGVLTADRKEDCRRRSDKPTPCPTEALATVVPAPCWPPATCPAVAWRPGALCPALQPTGPQDPEASPPVSPTEPTEQPAAVQWSLRGTLSAGVPTPSSSLPGLQRFPPSLVGPLGFPPRNLQTDRTLCSGATRTCSPCSPPPVH